MSLGRSCRAPNRLRNKLAGEPQTSSEGPENPRERPRRDPERPRRGLSFDHAFLIVVLGFLCRGSPFVSYCGYTPASLS